MSVEELDFSSLDTIELPVKYRNRAFVLREASCEVYCKYQDAIRECVIYDDKGVRTGYRNLSSVEPLLVSMCLVEMNNGGLNAVSWDEVKSWDHKVVKKLFDRVMKISEMDEEEKKEDTAAKNGQSG